MAKPHERTVKTKNASMFASKFDRYYLQSIKYKSLSHIFTTFQLPGEVHNCVPLFSL